MLLLLRSAILSCRISVQKSWKNFFNNTKYCLKIPFTPFVFYDVLFNFARTRRARVRCGIPFLPQPGLPAAQRHLFFIGFLSGWIFADWELGFGIRRRLFVVPLALAGNSHANSPDAPAARSLFSREDTATHRALSPIGGPD